MEKEKHDYLNSLNAAENAIDAYKMKQKNANLKNQNEKDIYNQQISQKNGYAPREKEMLAAIKANPLGKRGGKKSRKRKSVRRCRRKRFSRRRR